LPVNLEIASLTIVPSSKAKASPALSFFQRLTYALLQCIIAIFCYSNLLL